MKFIQRPLDRKSTMTYLPNKSWKWVRLERGRIIRMAPPMHSENEWDEKGTVPALTTPAYASDLATAG